jgi:undecaprenyl-diphosphatase
MTYLDAIILGILQGLTEFLPVSSSGHLVLAKALLNVTQPGLSFEIMVHLGTLLSVLVYFRKSVWRLIQSLFIRERTADRRLLYLLALGTVPAGLAGVLFKDLFERSFSNPLLTSIMLLLTGAILLATRFAPRRSLPVRIPSALAAGIGQAMAIMPGISRSGTTIAAALFAGVRPDTAAEFAFLLAIPAIGGATVLEISVLAQMESAALAPILVGTACAFATGLVAVYVVMSAIRKGTFSYFAYYCFAAGALGLYLFV